MSSLNIGELTGFIGLNTNDLTSSAQQGERSVQQMAARVLSEAQRIERQAFTVRLDAQAEDVDRKIQDVRGRLDQLRSQPATAQVQADIAQAERELTDLEHTLAGINTQRIRVRIEADTAEADAQIDQAAEGWKTKTKLAAAAAGAAAGGALGYAAAQAVDMEAVNAKFRIQLGGSADYAGEMGAIAGNLFGRGYADNMGAVNDAVKNVIQSGALMEDATNEQIESMSAKAMTLGKVYEQDVGLVAIAAGQMVRNGLADADEAMDVLAKGLEEAGAAGDDLLESFQEYSPMFSTLGLSAADSMGLMQQGLAGGARNLDQVGDALKEFSLRAIDGSKTTVEGFTAIGLNAEQMGAKIAGGGAGAREGLQQVLDGLRGIEDPVARNTAAVALFGTKAEDMKDALFQMDVSTATQSLGDFAGAAEEASRIMEETASQKVQGLRNEFDLLMASLISMDGPMGTAAGAVAAFGPDALSMVGSLAMISMAWGKAGLAALVNGAKMAAGWIMAMGPVGWIIAAVVALVALIIANWDTVVEWTKAAWDWIVGIVKGAWDWIVSIIQPVIQFIWQIIQMHLTVIQTIFTTVWNVIVTIFTTVWNIIKGVVQFALGIILAIIFTVWNAVSAVFMTVWNAIVAFFTPIIEGIVAVVTTAWNFMYEIVSTVLTAISDFISMVWNAILEFLTPIFEAISTAVSAAWDAILNVITTVMDAIWGVIEPIWNTIAGFFTSIWEKISSAVSTGAGKVWDFLTGLWDKIKGVAGEAINWLVDAGKNIVQGLWNGITGMGTWLYDKIMGWIKNVVPGPVLSFLGIASPSKYMRDEVGHWIPAGIAEGITANSSTAASAARDVAMDVATAASQAVAGGDGSWIDPAGAFLGGFAIQDRVDPVLAASSALTPSLAAMRRPGDPEAGGGAGTTVNVYNPQAEKASDSLNREARTLGAMGLLPTG